MTPLEADLLPETSHMLCYELPFVRLSAYVPNLNATYTLKTSSPRYCQLISLVSIRPSPQQPTTTPPHSTPQTPPSKRSTPQRSAPTR